MKKPSITFAKANLALAISSIALSNQALTQDLGADTTPKQTWAIEEVIVTSQKRMQTLQDIPIAVSAYSGDFIAQSNIKDVKTLTTMTPGVTGDTDDSFLDTINIRGIVTNDFGLGAEPSIGLYQDGIYLGRTGGAVTSFYDVEMIEVVKGPQGTLFGRNSSAGAISISTKKPSDVEEGSIKVGAGENSHASLEAMYNTPISDTFAIRAAYYHTEEDGWIKNLDGGPDYGGNNVDAGRISFGYMGDLLIATLSLEYEDREQNGAVYNVLNVPGQPQLAGWQQPSSEHDEVANDLGRGSKDEGEVWGATLTLEYDLSDEYALTSVTGIRGHNYTYVEDFDGSAFALSHYAQDQTQDYYSQEFRINYEGDGNITWFAGVSFYKEELEAEVSDIYDEDTYCTFTLAYNNEVYDQSTYNGCADYGSGFAGGAGMVSETRLVDAEYDGWGVYGDLTWTVHEDVDITIGARYTEDERDLNLWVLEDSQHNNPSIYGGPAYTDGYIKDSESWDNVSPRLAVNWYVNYDISVYANISQGYKAGGYNTTDIGYSDPDRDGNFFFNEAVNGRSTDATNDAVLETFDQEEVLNTELGIKSKWWDNRVEFKASVFQYTFDDYQVNFFDSNVNATRVVNAGDAEGKGFEADIRILPTANWDIYLGIAFLDTELSDLKETDLCETNCEGNTLPGTVESSYALAATYTIPFRESELSFTLENFYQDDFSVDFDDRNGLEGEDFSKFNIRAAYRHDDGWSAEVYVENVTDEEYYKNAAFQDGAIGAHRFGPAQQRFAGILLGYEF